MTIEQKAKAYDEAIDRAKKWHNAPNADKIPTLSTRVIEEIFPELKESEDERIRKWCIKLIKATCDYDSPTSRKEVDDAIAWLEKQGESNLYSGVSFNYNGDIWGMCARDNGVDILFNKKLIQHVSNREQNEPKPQGKTALEAAKEEKVDNQNCVKPADKVEPKFHKGDWIISDTANKDYRICKITDVKDGNYAIESIYGYKGYNQFDVFDNTYRLWDITKDAKDGDVLVSQYGRPFIYNDNRDSILIGSYCGISVVGNFVVATEKCHWTENMNIHPATKEQRDTLMKAMADAGYTFDFESKELKKIKQKPTDEEMKELLRTEYEKGRADAIAETQVAWSEEDSVRLQRIIDFLWHNRKGDTDEIYQQEQDIDWLKSLKPHTQWKPSEKQMEALDYYANSLCTYCDRQDDLRSLYNDLKKLKEE